MTMRTKMLMIFAAAYLLAQTTETRAQSDSLRGGIFIAPNAARRVTLSRNAALLHPSLFPRGRFSLCRMTTSNPCRLLMAGSSVMGTSNSAQRHWAMPSNPVRETTRRPRMRGRVLVQESNNESVKHPW
jgi:hypothetical protein